MRRILFLSVTLVFISLCSFSQNDEKFKMGVFISPNISQSHIVNTNLISNAEIEPKTRFGFGLIFLYKINQKLGLRSLIETEFREESLTYQENNENKKENLDLYALNFPIQINYFPLNNLDLIISYSPKFIKPDDDYMISENIASFDSSLDFGIGYEFNLPSMIFHPEFRYCYGLTNIWDGTDTTLGQSITSMKTRMFSIVLSIYAGKSK